MNEGRIWTVVKPNHGVPLFLGGVAVISIIVHFAILNHTTWFSALAGWCAGTCYGNSASAVKRL